MKTLNTIELRNQLINSLLNQGYSKKWVGLFVNRIIYGLK